MKKQASSFDSSELREFGEVLCGRRTINLFLQTPVPAELVRDAVEVATWAPNHHVTEPWAFYTLGKQTMAACLDLRCKSGRIQGENMVRKAGLAACYVQEIGRAGIAAGRSRSLQRCSAEPDAVSVESWCRL